MILYLHETVELWVVGGRIGFCILQERSRETILPVLNGFDECPKGLLKTFIVSLAVKDATQ